MPLAGRKALRVKKELDFHHCLDVAFRLGDRVLAAGWIAFEPSIAFAPSPILTGSSGEARPIFAAWLPRPDVANYLKSNFAAQRVKVLSYLIEVSTPDAALTLSVADLEIAVRPVEALTIKPLLPYLEKEALKTVQGGALDLKAAYPGSFGARLQQIIEARDPNVPKSFHLEARSAPPYSFVDSHRRLTPTLSQANGWLATADATCTSFFAEFDDGEIAYFDALPQYPRPDVGSFLRDNLRPSVQSSGFIALVPTPADRTMSKLHLQIGDLSVPLVLQPTTGGSVLDAAVDALNQPWPIEFDLPGMIGKLVDVAYAKVLESQPKPVTLVATGPDQPTLSFIIPLYERWDFAVYHAAMFEALHRQGLAFELVYVIDDPKLEKPFVEWVKTQATPAYGFRVVSNRGNFGYAKANNSGASVARGEYLVLMNSDIYVDYWGGVHAALAKLKNDPETSLIGFTLFYEDDTVQHDGMSLGDGYRFMGMDMPDHPRKGMPLKIDGISIEPEPLLTGAFLMCRAGDYAEVGGLPSDYVVGDFEDLDFSMIMSRRGLNQIVRAHGIYHLERQSFAASNRSDVRQAVLVRNAAHFWNKHRVDQN